LSPLWQGIFSVYETVTVLGYHGTSKQAADIILAQGFHTSQNEYDWLGEGVYFWQDAPERAWAWAEELHGADGAVLVSRIDLSSCIDFLDIIWGNLFTEIYNQFLSHWKQIGLLLPLQKGKAHRLDRAVINYACGILDEQGFIIKSVRSAFREGKPIYPDSALFHRSHVQIAVRNLSIIEETHQVERR